MIDITVFIPIYNSEKYLKKSIQSVLNQTFNNFELLIINDATTDDSVSIVNSFSDKRIRLIHNKKNEGICNTRKKGVLEAKGKYIAILDADDIAMPKRLEKQFLFLEENPDYALCGSNAFFIDQNDNLIEHLHKVNYTSKDIKLNSLFANQFINSSVLVRKECILTVGNYSMKYCEDYDIFIKLIEKFKTSNLKEKLICYRMHPDNNSRKNILKYDNAVKVLLNYQYKKLNINPKQNYIPYLLFHDDIYNIKTEDIHAFFNDILSENRNLKIYDNNTFEEKFISIWIKLILHHKMTKETWKLFLSPYFKYKYLVNTKQKRRFLKLLINPFRI